MSQMKLLHNRTAYKYGNSIILAHFIHLLSLFGFWTTVYSKQHPNDKKGTHEIGEIRQNNNFSKLSTVLLCNTFPNQNEMTQFGVPAVFEVMNRAGKKTFNLVKIYKKAMDAYVELIRK